VLKAVFFDLGDTLIVEQGDKHLVETPFYAVPQAEETLIALKRKGLKVGIITNTTTSREKDVRKVLQQLRLESYVDFIVTSVDAGCEKPDGRIFSIALRTAGVKATEAVMVGDQVAKDIVGGNRIGMKTILFKWNQRYPETAIEQEEQPTCAISRLKELLHVLDQLARAREDRVMKEWDEASESWVDFVRQGKDYYRDELNNPAAFRLIGNVRNQLVLDLACGEGYNTRILAMKGARVIGVDFSTRLLELARIEEAKEKLGIDYHVADAADLSRFPSNHFDIVTCFMALQDIKNYKKAIAEVARVLKSKGRFVFSIPHPCFEMVSDKGNRVSTSERYFGDREDHIQWKMERLLKPFETTGFHRTLTEYFAVFHENRLLVRRLIEPRPTKRGIMKHPPLRDVLLRPQSVVIEAVEEPV
jgi:HAD superfamily hydrolase (TIGR01662 family)